MGNTGQRKMLTRALLLRMSEPMDETFKKLAAIHRRSKSDYIRIVLEDHLNALKAQHDKKSKAS